MALTTLAQANAATSAEFAAAFAGIVEHSPWVAEAASGRRPFGSVTALWQAMMDCIAEAAPDRRLALIRAHPDLAGQEARAGTMTSHSTSEQSRLGLDALTGEEARELDRLNRDYRERFGFPCIIALRLHRDKASVLEAFRRRLANSRGAEIDAALREIGVIVRGRIDKMLTTGAGWLTTHVLDTHSGLPAVAMAVVLERREVMGWREIARTTTNAAGRTDQHLLPVGAMARGRYRLTFDVGGYFATRAVDVSSPAFLDGVPIEFGIADVDAHYHVPLLCSPWSYSTYRGS